MNEDRSGPVEETPLYIDPPAATGSYYLNHAKLQAFAEEQLSDSGVNFQFIRPLNEMDENSNSRCITRGRISGSGLA